MHEHNDKIRNTGRVDGVFITIGSSFSAGRGVLGMEGRRGFMGVYLITYILQINKHTE